MSPIYCCVCANEYEYDGVTQEYKCEYSLQLFFSVLVEVLSHKQSALRVQHVRT